MAISIKRPLSDQPEQEITLPVISLGREVLAGENEALEREWLVTNAIGGYASASLAGANTRRYHGLLVAAFQPPLGRTVLLGKLDETVNIAGQSFELAVNEWQSGAASLEGLRYLQQFELEGTLPVFSYRLGEATLIKKIWMEYGLNTTYIQYSYEGPESAGPLQLELRPLLNNRDYHGDTHGSPDWHFKIEAESGVEQSWTVQAWEEAPRWRLMGFGAKLNWKRFEKNGWYWNFRYRQEQARGLSAGEDMYCAGTLWAELQPGQTLTVVASTELPEVIVTLFPGSRERELKRQRSLLERACEVDTRLDAPGASLVLAADQFIAGRPDWARPGRLLPEYRTVIAGYHWFGDWGRDTMISLPGLTLATGRYSEAAVILRSFARFISRGMLPNRFPDNPAASATLPESEYNTVDATLWYLDALGKYFNASGDWSLGKELYPILTEIIRYHVEGTRFNIRLAADGLLASGAEGVQLTWMDAKVGDWVVTPRHGKPIEINALWYRACRVLEELSRFFAPDRAAYYKGLAEKVAANFEQIYWNKEASYYYDLINEFGDPDTTLRPNQIIAMAVAPELFTTSKAQAALEKVREYLLTPVGLRSLTPLDPAYRPTYGGDPFSRDSAYHQGTIWPWLLGPYGQALRHFAGVENAFLLAPFIEQLKLAGIGQVNEIYGAEPPYPPVGCIAQAWSVAQLLELSQILNKQE
ncbi:MAG TPA: amylo-alpha-1,6-glucosidase [Chloroflexia bacterium]|nr:amylo-alpha-1,6-glucosidase [Chloroflexia bacterium]